MSLSQPINHNRTPAEQMTLFPQTRYMGSKSKLIDYIWETSEKYDFESVIDLFSGSGVVSYMYKTHGKKVYSNDYMAMGSVLTKALIENNTVILPLDAAKELMKETATDHFVQNTFSDIYFSTDDNMFIDIVRANIKKMSDDYQRAIAMEALIRSCIKKRPRGIFTYVGHRYDDGRKDLQKSFETHFLESVNLINNAVFDNKKKNKSYNMDSMNFKKRRI